MEALNGLYWIIALAGGAIGGVAVTLFFEWRRWKNDPARELEWRLEPRPPVERVEPGAYLVDREGPRFGP